MEDSKQKQQEDGVVQQEDVEMVQQEEDVVEPTSEDNNDNQEKDDPKHSALSFIFGQRPNEIKLREKKIQRNSRMLNSVRREPPKASQSHSPEPFEPGKDSGSSHVRSQFEYCETKGLRNSSTNSRDHAPGAVALEPEVVVGESTDPNLTDLNVEEEGRIRSTRPGPPPAGSSTDILVQDQQDDSTWLEAVAVNEDALMHQAEDNVIASAAKAEAINLDKLWRQRCFAGTFLLLILTAVAIGVGVGVSKSREDDRAIEGLSANGQRAEAIVESIDSNFGEYFSVARYSTIVNGTTETVVDGFVATVNCRPLACVEESGSDACFADEYYEHGCCAGEDCPEDDKCGEICPRDRASCWPKREDCRSSSCYECATGPNDEPLYQLSSFKLSINCLATGTKMNPDNGQEYKWSISCGPVELGGSVEQNIANGEYVCVAHRDGPGINVTRSWYSNCQWIQLNECGCAPHDVFPFGVEPPNPETGWTPCLTEEDCPFLCSDAGTEKAKNLCYAFEGIDWWEGANPWNMSLFIHEFGFDESVTKIALY